MPASGRVVKRLRPDSEGRRPLAKGIRPPGPVTALRQREGKRGLVVSLRENQSNSTGKLEAYALSTGAWGLLPGASLGAGPRRVKMLRPRLGAPRGPRNRRCRRETRSGGTRTAGPRPRCHAPSPWRRPGSSSWVCGSRDKDRHLGEPKSGATTVPCVWRLRGTSVGRVLAVNCTQPAPTGPKAEASSKDLSDRCHWGSSADVAASTRLITQRSLVQIQPPQP